MTDVLIKRELLERLATECETETEWNCANVPAGTRAATTRAIAMKSAADSIRAILAAPVQGEAVEEIVPKWRYDALVQHCKLQDKNIAKLSDERNTAWMYEQREVWFWQGDGEDYPESLSCPVVIKADDLRAILAPPQPAEVGELVEALKRAREYIASQPVKVTPTGVGGRRGYSFDAENYPVMRVLDRIDAALAKLGGQGMKPMSLKFVCDICGRKRSHGAKKIDHSKCSKIRQEKHRG